MRGPRWYVVAAKPECVHATALAVEALGYAAFLPLVSCPHPRAGRWLRPMFGNYVFAYFDLADPGWYRITRLHCVPKPSVLSSLASGEPSPVPDRLVERIHSDIGRRIEDVVERQKHRERRGGGGVVADPVAVLVSIGAEVRLKDGAGAGSTGVVTATRSGARQAQVAIEGAILPVWVPADRLELLGEAA